MSAWWLLAPGVLVLGWLLARGALGGRALPVALALAAGLVGYGVFGRPSLPARPGAVVTKDPMAQPAMVEARGRLMSNAGDVGAWLTLADGLARSGDTEEAVRAMEVATGNFPRSPDLWVGLGNALVLHADGQVTPAARLAFGRASVADPKHPGPRYFLGLAYLQAGKPREARVAWEELKANSPAGAPWLADLDRKIAATRIMEGMGVGG